MKRYLLKQLRDCQQELNEINKSINKDPLNSNVQYLTMYALIKSCGTVENVFRSIIYDYVNRTKKIQLQNYIVSTVRRSQINPSYKNICELLGKFDDQWKTKFHDKVNNNRLKLSLTSLVDNRNDFAHGKNPNISFCSIKNYYNDTIEILKIIDKIVR